MAEELGFRTPAKEVEKLQKRLGQIEGLSTGVKDALGLSVSALIAIFAARAASEPKNARKIKDELMGIIKRMGISPALVDILEDSFKATCDELDTYLQGKQIKTVY